MNNIIQQLPNWYLYGMGIWGIISLFIIISDGILPIHFENIGKGWGFGLIYVIVRLVWFFVFFAIVVIPWPLTILIAILMLLGR